MRGSTYHIGAWFQKK